jgi:hypothetical protein
VSKSCDGIDLSSAMMALGGYKDQWNNSVSSGGVAYAVEGTKHWTASMSSSHDILPIRIVQLEDLSRTVPSILLTLYDCQMPLNYDQVVWYVFGKFLLCG